MSLVAPCKHQKINTEGKEAIDMKKMIILFMIMSHFLYGCKSVSDNNNEDIMYFFRNDSIHSFSDGKFEKIIECKDNFKDGFVPHGYFIYQDWLYYQKLIPNDYLRGDVFLFRQNIENGAVEQIIEKNIRAYTFADEYIYYIQDDMLKRVDLNGDNGKEYNNIKDGKRNYYDLFSYKDAIILQATEGGYFKVNKENDEIEQIIKKDYYTTTMYDNKGYAFSYSYDENTNIGSNYVIELDFQTGGEKILYQEDEIEDPEKNTNETPYYNETGPMIAKDGVLYFSRNKGTYSISLQTNEVQKLSDFSCLYIEKIMDNKIYCYFPTESDFLTPGLEPDKYKLISLDIETGEIEEHLFPED